MVDEDTSRGDHVLWPHQSVLTTSTWAQPDRPTPIAVACQRPGPGSEDHVALALSPPAVEGSYCVDRVHTPLCQIPLSGFYFLKKFSKQNFCISKDVKVNNKKIKNLKIIYFLKKLQQGNPFCFNHLTRSIISYNILQQYESVFFNSLKYIEPVWKNKNYNDIKQDLIYWLCCKVLERYTSKKP